MWRFGGKENVLITAGIDLALFVAALFLGAPIKYALIGLGAVAFLEFFVATL